MLHWGKMYFTFIYTIQIQSLYNCDILLYVNTQSFVVNESPSINLIAVVDTTSSQQPGSPRSATGNIECTVITPRCAADTHAKAHAKW